MTKLDFKNLILSQGILIQEDYIPLLEKADIKVFKSSLYPKDDKITLNFFNNYREYSNGKPFQRYRDVLNNDLEIYTQYIRVSLIPEYSLDLKTLENYMNHYEILGTQLFDYLYENEFSNKEFYIDLKSNFFFD